MDKKGFHIQSLHLSASAAACLLTLIYIPCYTQDLSSTNMSPVTNQDTSVWIPAFKHVRIISPYDSTVQHAYFYKSVSPETRPLVVQLHSWTYDYRQFDSVAVYCLLNDLNFIHPDFRGPNKTKYACCSDLVISDIDAAIDYAINNGNVDTSRIFVIGQSGGGYATLAIFMKSKHKIRKFSAWCSISDLVRWYEETKIRKLYYARDILNCTNSIGDNLNVEEAVQRSPFYWDTPVRKLDYCRLDIFAGVYDGLENNGPVPITQSINFYNKLLADLIVVDSSRYVSNSEKLNLLEFRKPLADFGQIGNRDICLIKETGNLRLTIFTGMHEMLIKYAIDELLKQ